MPSEAFTDLPRSTSLKLVCVTSPTRSGLLSENKATMFIIPFTKYNTFADRGFSVQGRKAWNDLPDDLISITDYNLFKKKLKIHKFEQF